MKYSAFGGALQPHGFKTHFIVHMGRCGRTSRVPLHSFIHGCTKSSLYITSRLTQVKSSRAAWSFSPTDWPVNVSHIRSFKPVTVQLLGKSLKSRMFCRKAFLPLSVQEQRLRILLWRRKKPQRSRKEAAERPQLFPVSSPQDVMSAHRQQAVTVRRTCRWVAGEERLGLQLLF